jgi:hypothetical protein
MPGMIGPGMPGMIGPGYPPSSGSCPPCNAWFFIAI